MKSLTAYDTAYSQPQRRVGLWRVLDAFSWLSLRWSCASLPALRKRQRITARNLCMRWEMWYEQEISLRMSWVHEMGYRATLAGAVQFWRRCSHARHAVAQSWDGGGHIYQFTCWILVVGESQPTVMVSQMAILYQLLKTRIYYAFY